MSKHQKTMNVGGQEFTVRDEYEGDAVEVQAAPVAAVAEVDSHAKAMDDLRNEYQHRETKLMGENQKLKAELKDMQAALDKERSDHNNAKHEHKKLKDKHDQFERISKGGPDALDKELAPLGRDSQGKAKVVADAPPLRVGQV